jgi:hypothetical protein
MTSYFMALQGKQVASPDENTQKFIPLETAMANMMAKTDIKGISAKDLVERLQATYDRRDVQFALQKALDFGEIILGPHLYLYTPQLIADAEKEYAKTCTRTSIEGYPITYRKIATKNLFAEDAEECSNSYR